MKKKQFVLDCSVTIAWCLEEEHSHHALSILEMLKQQEAVVPAIWSYEVGNVLCLAEKRKRITKLQSSRYKTFLNELPISIDLSFEQKIPERICELALNNTLTVYDAAYLDLALHHNIPLATLDKALAKVAHQMGLQTL